MLKKTVIAAGILITLYGCASTKTDTINSKAEVVGQVKDIEISGLSSKRVNGDFVAEAIITNTSNDTPQDIFYRCHFYDAKKTDLSSDATWNPLQIYGGQRRTVECTSDSEQTKDFRFEISSTKTPVNVDQ